MCFLLGAGFLFSVASCSLLLDAGRQIRRKNLNTKQKTHLPWKLLAVGWENLG
jgi:hypothetical protein